MPRDQAFYAASYAAKAPDALDKTRVEPLEGEGVWWCSYRYNPSHTQQPAPRAPPPVVKELSREVHRRCGQVCNHAVVNRYRDGFDAIGAHGDKATDLEDGSFVVSVSFGATRRMVFEPRVEAPSADGSERVVRAKTSRRRSWRWPARSTRMTLPYRLRARSVNFSREGVQLWLHFSICS